MGLPDDRVLIKKIVPGSSEGLFHLHSEREPEIRDVWIKLGGQGQKHGAAMRWPAVQARAQTGRR